jgi:TonB family protein
MGFLGRYSLKLALFVAFLLAGSLSPVAAQQSAAGSAGPTLAGSANLSQAQIDNIIRKFAAKETEFRRALNEYFFRRDALVQEVGMGGQVMGEYHRVSDFTFDDKGNRYEKINFFPMPSMPSLTVTQEDLEDLGGVNPFALEASKLDQYTFKYVGKERIDELDLYVFDVAPKVVSKKTFPRFFVGRIWVDDQDLQIVKSKGKGSPETKNNKFPIVETYREQIDGKYWFPTYSYADDDLVFDSGQNVRLRMRIKYSDYKVGRGRVTIREVSEAPETIKPETESKPAAQPTPSPAKPSTGPGFQSDQIVDGGMLNGKAVELPSAKYPSEARQAKVTGTVQVQVVVDHNGKVLSAEAITGPDALRDAAVEAAKLAKFKPMVIDGVPVKVSGVLTYDFAPK